MSDSGSYYSRSFYLNVFLFTRKVSFIIMFLFVKGWDADRETLELAFLMTKIFSGFDLLTSIGLVVSSCMMVYGIKKEKDRFLLPAIYYIPIDGLLRFVLQHFNAIDRHIFCSFYRFIQVTAYTAIFGFLHPVSSIINAFYIVEIIIDFFIWLCVYSHR